MSKEKKYYIGNDEVKQFQVTDNIDLVGVKLENGKTKDYTVEQWESLKSETPYENGEISIRQFANLMVRILKQMAKSRVTIGEQAWILEQVSRTISSNYEASIAKLFNQSNHQQVMMSQIDEVLKQK